MIAHNMKCPYTILILFLALQTHAALYANIHFKNITIDNGLAHTDATCIAQDSCGLIWIGTNNGLQVYDGYDLDHYNYYSDSQQVYQHHNRIKNMVCTRTHLWIGTESGLACFDLNRRVFIPLRMDGWILPSQSGSSYQLAVLPHSHSLWILKDKKLSVANIQGNHLSKLAWESSEQALRFENDIYLLRSDGNTIWAMTNDKIILHLVIANGKIRIKEKFSNSELLDGEYALDLLSQKNHLYFKTDSQCIRFETDRDGNIVPPSKLTVKFDLASSKCGISVSNNTLVMDSNDNLYIPTYEGILMVRRAFSENPQQQFLFSDLKHGTKNLFIDRFHNLWITMPNWGIRCCSLNESSFDLVDIRSIHLPGIRQEDVSAITTGSGHSIWILTGEGVLVQYDKEKQKAVRVETKLKQVAPSFQSIAMSKDKCRLYVGTSDGMIIYDIATGKYKLHLPYYSFTVFKEMSENRLWAGTWNHGIVLLSLDKLNVSPLYELNKDSQLKFPANQISSMNIIRPDKLLCGTENGIVTVTLDKNFKPISTSCYQVNDSCLHSMSSNYIAASAVENDSVFWLGTIGGGACRVTVHSSCDNDYESRNYTVREHLPSNDVEMVFLDEHQNVWLGGYGITKIERNGERITSYNVSDGLQSNSFKIGAGCQGTDGTIYMGGLHGLNYFSADKIRLPIQNMELLITGMKIYSQSSADRPDAQNKLYSERNVNHLSKIELGKQENNFYIYFSALNYIHSDKVQYRYRMNNLHQGWVVLPRGQHYASFIDTPPGRYHFEVQLSTDNGASWKDTRKLDVVVHPAWWQTLWAKSLFFFVILTVLFTWIYTYIRSLKLQKENEIQKIKQQHAEENYQNKMRFFINVSHELKTPLALVKLAIDHIHSSSPSRDSKCVLQNVQYLNTLISELMEIRKNELGVAHLSCTRQDINKLVQEVVTGICPWAESKSIHINTDIPDVPLLMDFDRMQVMKLVLNLLSNAIKYTENGKQILCTSGLVNPHKITPFYPVFHAEGNLEEQTSVWALMVRDEGIGISQESIGNIYNRFFQVNNTNLTHLGSGIGLAVVKNIVLLHHGKIIVSSERMEGSEFIVMLPLHQADCSQQPLLHSVDVNNFIKQQYTEFKLQTSIFEDIQVKPHEGLPLILIVEDNVELLQMLVRDLGNDFQIETAVNGKAALDKCYSIYPELIVSDVMMPEMDGISFCKAVRANFSLAYIPFILLTAKNEVESQVEGYDSGADLYMSKPFSVQVLKVAIRQLLKRTKMRTQISTGDATNQRSKELSDETEPLETRSEKEEHEMQEFFLKVKDLIGQNLSDPDLGIDYLASSLGVSRSKLYQTLKRVTNITLSDYIRNLRLEKAAHLLRYSTKSIAEIMLETGYVNQSHFTRSFKQKYDITPKNYQLKKDE